MSLQRAVITIPVYKTKPDNKEQISLLQAFKVFADYDIVLVCPDNLDVSAYQKLAQDRAKEIRISRFDNLFFKDIEGYNWLMLNLSFYETFLAYEYILIYQPDCFVFRDELDMWMNKGYDYIGAPWLHNDRRVWWTLRKSITYTLKYLYRRYTNQDNTISIGFYKVGNGGFSLRKVSTACEMIKKFEKNGRIDRYRNANGNYLYAEDVFWGCEVNRYAANMKIPNYKVALGFAFDMNPSLCYELNSKELPFGVHAWYRYNLDFWKPFIEKEGYILSDHVSTK